MGLISIDVDQLAEQIARRVVERLSKEPPADRLISRRDVAQRLGRSISTIKRLQMTPGFPRPVRLDGGRPLWRASEIEVFLQESEA